MPDAKTKGAALGGLYGSAGTRVSSENRLSLQDRDNLISQLYGVASYCALILKNANTTILSSIQPWVKREICVSP